jgi:hypothetical protein
MTCRMVGVSGAAWGQTAKKFPVCLVRVNCEAEVPGAEGLELPRSQALLYVTRHHRSAGKSSGCFRRIIYFIAVPEL